MSDKVAQLIVDFVHGGDDSLPLIKRVELYRAFASKTSDTELAAHFFRCADELDASEQKCRQLLMAFHRDGKDAA